MQLSGFFNALQLRSLSSLLTDSTVRSFLWPIHLAANPIRLGAVVLSVPIRLAQSITRITDHDAALVSLRIGEMASRGSARGLLLLVGVLTFVSTFPQQGDAQAWAATSWTPAHATFYGGSDASGTMGGSCGYGNLYSTGYGVNTAALSVALFNNGLSCGACFLIECLTSQTSYCYAGASITVTATNECPDGSFGGWCDSPKYHFDLSEYMFEELANPVGGVIPVQYMRVPCQKSGGIVFQVNGNPYFLLILVTNVGGGGNVVSLGVQIGSSGFYGTSHNWGENWELDSHPESVGQSLGFQVGLENGATQSFSDVCPSNWGFSQSCESSSNF